MTVDWCQPLGGLQSALATAVVASDPQATSQEVSWLLQAVLGVNEAWLLTHPDRRLSQAEQDTLQALFARRLANALTMSCCFCRVLILLVSSLHLRTFALALNWSLLYVLAACSDPVIC